MRAESGSCGRAVRLNCISFVQQVFVVELLKQPPQRLDIFVVVCDVRIVEIDEISHFLRERAPLRREFHHILAALVVIVAHGDVLFGILVVYIRLCDSEFLLHSQFHRKSVCVPSCLTMNLEALHRLISVECIFYASCKDMMDSRVTVCRRRTLKENKLRTSLTFVYRFMENIFLIPLCQHLVISCRQIEPVMLCELLYHVFFFVI